MATPGTTASTRAGAAGPQTAPAPGEQLWLDSPRAAAGIRRAPRHLRKHLRSLADTGIATLPGAVPADLCDRVVADLDLYLRAHGEQVAAHADQHGRFRVNNFHHGSEASMSVALHPPVLELLDAALGYPAVPYSSLTFVRGTEQGTHRDGPFFATWPEGFFLGVWTALEDIHPDSGPLHYYPGGHRTAVDRQDSEAAYAASVTSSCIADGISPRTVPDLSKGDVVVWHPDLPHGGTPVLDRSLTRKSMVVHHKAGAVPLHGLQEFFGRGDRNRPDDARYVLHKDRWVVDPGFVGFAP